ncbi:A/G-specific adenine glycosylase [Erythrobacter sp. R86502]|uniref:A/G-specific adenine glycosylase n=1 Tax=Erythrobacter sp. R86502 TaxID=3093846 RepID=UPI0036D42C6A
MIASISNNLLAWYDIHARDLPWRQAPGSARPDDAAWPYRVWLSEVMLQQTTVAAVKPYFAKFLTLWPTVDALAAAADDDVLAAWAGLGYYSRARNLIKCARVVADRGGFPQTESELRQLPGLGDYTAAAVAAIAFGQRAVVVDANVERVVARLFAIDTPLPGARKAIRAAADTITPNKRAGDFAQALMDLGSHICTSRAPRCLLCPLHDDCEGRKSGEPERLPIKPARKAVPERYGAAFWITRKAGREVWLVTRPDTGMLGGMRALPDDGWTARRDGSGQPPLPGAWHTVGAVRHGFTHAHLTLEVRRLESRGENSPEMVGDGVWWPVSDIGEAGLATLFAKAAQIAIAVG